MTIVACCLWIVNQLWLPQILTPLRMEQRSMFELFHPCGFPFNILSLLLFTLSYVLCEFKCRLVELLLHFIHCFKHWFECFLACRWQKYLLNRLRSDCKEHFLFNCSSYLLRLFYMFFTFSAMALESNNLSVAIKQLFYFWLRFCTGFVNTQN